MGAAPSILALSTALVTLAALPLTAQDRPAGVRGGAPSGYVRFTPSIGRPTLGFVVETLTSDTDSIGAKVVSVTPGGPADRGGIRSGDIIVRLNGRPLIESQASGGSMRPAQAAPALRLLLLSAQLSPNDTVAVQLRRGKQVRNVRLVPEAVPVHVYRQQLDILEATRSRMAVEQGRTFERTPVRELEAATRVHELERTYMTQMPRVAFIMSALEQMQLAPLNEQLGQYFGTSNGVLVISVPEGSGLSLRGGDVVFRVDGRDAANPPHLLRILRSYENGESFELEIMRNRKRQTVTGSLAGR